MPGIFEKDPGPFFDANTFHIPRHQWYHPALAGSATIAHLVHAHKTLNEYRNILNQLEPDDYTQFLQLFISRGLDLYGGYWRYADICTVLLGIAMNLNIHDYLEIGVRRGRSMSMIAHSRPAANIVGFDWWKEGYAGMDNPGPTFVRNEMAKLGHTGSLDLISGDSHVTVPEYFQKHPDAFFDCITVDGDHTEEGAMADLITVIPRLRVGGILVFDDIAHPQHPYLRRAWNQIVGKRQCFSSYEFTEIGYGVAFAVRTYNTEGSTTNALRSTK